MKFTKLIIFTKFIKFTKLIFYTLKVKQLTKELNSRKSASPASSSTFGDDSLDKAIQDELNQRAVKAEKALKDSQQQIQGNIKIRKM